MSTLSDPIETAILANISALHFTAANLSKCIAAAHAAMRNGDRNLAIGNLLDLEQLMPEADALYRAAMALHRNHHRTC